MSSAPIRLNVPQQKVLHALGRIPFATNKQLCRMLFAPTSQSFVRTITKQLEDAGLIARDWVEGKHRIQAESIFCLTERGRRMLMAEGRENLPAVQRSHDHSGLFQKHTLGISDILISAYRLQKADPERVIVLEATHDAELHRTPIPLKVEGKEYKFIPDAWLHLSVDGVPFPMSFELDRGTEEEKKWRHKVRCLLAFASGPVMDWFRVRNFAIVIPVCPEDFRSADHRLEKLMWWTEKELTKLGQEDWGQLFLFRAVDAGIVDPIDYFTAPSWRSPFDESLHPLIEGY